MTSADPREVRLIREAGARSVGKGADVDLVAPITPPAEFTAAGKPGGYPWMEPGACFRNAFTLVTSAPSLLYGEGLALLPLSEGWTMWVHHAWVIDPGYRAVDVTWREAGARYIGITVSRDELRARQLRKQARRGLVEPVLAAMPLLADDLTEAKWRLADWFTGRTGQARAGPALEAE